MDNALDASAPGSRVVLVGGECVVGRALLDSWQLAGVAATVVGRAPADGTEAEVAGHPVVDVNRRAAVASALSGAAELVILGATGVRDADGSGIGLLDEPLVAAVLAEAARNPPGHVTVLSTALAYELAVGGPSLRTENDPLVPGRVRAVADRVRLESLVAGWEATTKVPVAVLRPVLVASVEARSWFGRSAWRNRRLCPSPRPVVQYVLLRDVVGAAEVVRRRRAAGAFNVAPDGWLEGAETVELADRRFVVGAPPAVLAFVEWLRWWTWWSPTPPALLDLARHDVAVDSARLRSEGWASSHSNTEAFLVAHAPAWWPSLSARRRQDLVLGGALMTVAAASAAAVVALRRVRRS
ncbi:MAG: hypothetical protein R2754_18205 [Microthrixaceae bacterium]